MTRPTAFLAALTIAAALLAILLGRERPAEDVAPPPAPFDAAAAQPFLESYAALLHAAYSDALALAVSLREAVDRFVAQPTAPNLDACKAAWRKARPAYLETEIARFSDGPIDAHERFLNAWPLDESYLDYVQGAPAAGLVNDPAGFPRIDAAALRGAHEKGGETHVAAGWHAIEFLLWGQDLELGPGGGKRSPLDYVPGGGTAANEARRGTCLRACAQMLVEDLALVRAQWAADQPLSYRVWLTYAATKPKLAKVLTGIGTLVFGELRGERLVVPFTLKDRENEHSCFSDTTHLDLLHDMLGVRNVWEGRYRSSDGRNDHAGPGLRDLAHAADPALAGEVEARIAAAIDALRHPALDPFELAVLGDDAAPGRRAIQAALDRLAEFNRSFCALAARLGVPVATLLPR
jgi:putative iron-regulated protein